MISIKLAVLIFLLFAIFEFFVLSAVMVFDANKKKLEKMMEITEIREEIIQAAIDNCGCSHRSEGDADYDIDGVGTGKIHKILEGML